MSDLAVHIYERKGLLRSWKFRATYYCPDRTSALAEFADPGAIREMQKLEREMFIDDWTIWGNARPGRRVEFTGLKPPPPPEPDPDAPVQRAPRNERWS